MKRNAGGWVAVTLLAVGIGLAGCTKTPTSTSEGEKPAKVEAVAGKDTKKVTLTDKAVSRLGIETTQLAAAPAEPAADATASPAAPMMTVPYSAVIYSADGDAWVYTVPGARTYQREKVVVANVGGDQGTTAWLSAGPPVGTTVVTVGVPELYGAELGVGK